MGDGIKEVSDPWTYGKASGLVTDEDFKQN